MTTPLNPDAVTKACIAYATRGHSFPDPTRLEIAIRAYLDVAQQDLERRIRAEVCRIVANTSNWPTPVGVQMLGRDLSEPIDKIVEAVLSVIHPPTNGT